MYFRTDIHLSLSASDSSTFLPTKDKPEQCKELSFIPFQKGILLNYFTFISPYSHVSEQFSGFSLRWATTVFKVISSEWFPMKALAIRYCNDFMPVVIIPHRYSWTCIDIFQWKNFKHLATDCDIRRAKRANHESQWSLEIMFWKRKKTSNVNPQNNLFFMPTDCWVYPFAHQFLFSFFFHQRTERSNIKRWWVNLGSPQIRCRLWKMCIKNHPVRNWIAQLWLLTAISFKLRCYFI